MKLLTTFCFGSTCDAVRWPSDPATGASFSVRGVAYCTLNDDGVIATHHDYYDAFHQTFPRVRLQRGKRFVRSSERIFTAGGLTSGMDLALHVVDLYFGRAVAEQTASYMEYEGMGWKRADG